ncbi:MAG: hypothetical protein R3185_04310 [Candidatus Thermoplasmatota archaeon]|nr:hypothetical protein [Candidatus Thermoplasmatota archaeon]
MLRDLKPWHLHAALALVILALAWLAPRLGLHGGQPWAHVGRAVLLMLLATALWTRHHHEPAASLAGVAIAYVLAALLSLALATNVDLFNTSIPSMLALAAPLIAIAWELLVARPA